MGWFVGPKFLLCDGLGWVGLSRVEEIGLTDNSCNYVLPLSKSRAYTGCDRKKHGEQRFG